jgi:propionyl-CoA carboxylase alpha chain
MARVRSPRVAALARLMPVKLPPDTSKMLLCPMPGVITSVSVQAGDQVEAGQVLATVEAMKMENVLKAERRGVVKHIASAAGQSLGVDELIMEFE